MCGAHLGGGRGHFVHEALFYRRKQQAVDAVREFVSAGVAQDEHVLVAMRPEMLDRLRPQLTAYAGSVSFEDITKLGANPARILPRICQWLDVHPGHARVVTEPLWPGRRAAERTEVVRHEALLNLARPGGSPRLLCVYGDDALDAEAAQAVERTHPRVSGPGPVRRASPSFTHPEQTLRATERRLAPPEEPIEELPITEDLQAVRQRVSSSLLAEALPDERREDFVLAVNEAATNALKYDHPPRRVRLWRSGPYLVGEVAARGEIDDPLAGRLPPSPAAVAGRGLWMVHQLCDLVEVRNYDSQATLRIHMRCA